MDKNIPAAQHVLITGAAKGIGRALVELYLGKGWRVSALDIDAAPLAPLLNHAPLATFPCDVSDEESFSHAMGEAVQRHGRIHLWINNAGISRIGPFEKMELKEFRKIMKVNFEGVLIGSHLAQRHMREPVSGTIVNLASLNGHIPAPFMTAYAASKHAVVGFTRSLHEEFEQTQYPLRVLLVSPGFVQTAIVQGHEGFELPEWMKMLSGKPEDVARDIYLAVERGDSMSFPTLHGKFLQAMHRMAPVMTLRASRLLVAKNWKELLGLKAIER